MVEAFQEAEVSKSNHHFHSSFLNSFIEVQLMYNKLHMFEMYN